MTHPDHAYNNDGTDTGYPHLDEGFCDCNCPQCTRDFSHPVTGGPACICPECGCGK